MNFLLLGLTVCFFVLAGYYGAVRSVLLDISFDRYSLRHEKEEELIETLSKNEFIHHFANKKLLIGKIKAL